MAGPVSRDEKQHGEEAEFVLARLMFAVAGRDQAWFEPTTPQ
ncbi:hypothetical protein ACIOJD_19030 [Streptomyces sp. NPDC088116]